MAAYDEQKNLEASANWSFWQTAFFRDAGEDWVRLREEARAKLTGILMHVTKKVTTIQVTTTRVTTTRVFYAGTTTVIDTTKNYDDMLSNRALCFSQRNEL